MSDLAQIEQHMRDKFQKPDPFVVRRLRVLEEENDMLRHRIKCLQAEVRGLYAKLESFVHERKAGPADLG